VLNNDSTDSRRYWSLSDYYNITLEEPTLAMIAASVKVNNHYQRLVSKKYRHNIELLNVDLMKEAEQAVYGWTHDFESLLPKD
jgi:hypothetical protein